MPIDVDVALNAELDPIEFSWASSDVQLYHLGLGAGADPMDPRELRYLVDDTPQVLPTFGNVAATFHATKPPTVQFPGIDIELSKVLHASERVEVPGPLPPSGSAKAVTRFTDIWDKGKAAVIWSETTVTAPDGTLLWTQRRSIFARGEGGFGGERGPSGVTPHRSGPRPGGRRADPAAAGAALPAVWRPQPAPLRSRIRRCRRLSQPILHGLCTYGMTCKAITDALLDGDAAAVTAYGARFAGVAFPGETLKVGIWKEGGRFLASVVAPSRDNAVVSGVELVPA